MQINFLNPEFLFKKIYDFFTGVALLPFLFLFIEWLREFLERIKGVSTIISLVLLTGIGYSIIRIRQIRKREEEFFAGLAEVAPAKMGNGATVEGPRNMKWEKIQEHINSPNAADWRLAILEADILLDELLDAMKYRGESIGEKLKKIEQSDFTTLDLAWEAHRIRNQVAHEGSEFLLSDREARRVIKLYEEVFKEFQYI
ncbi:MAG: hypothetical protein UX81_C0011G0015 [Parcubacteria group bacterium GW2011_GWA2_47_12]|nr:MAG: hypothetical protein UX81_C0011G0015 [Parcubacteria group bacterium GW2011_GWA2_47_12]